MDIKPDIAAAAVRQDLVYWEAHPDVLRVDWVKAEDAGDPAQGDVGELRIWLKPHVDAPDIVRLARAARPTRPCELEAFGAGEVHLTFWDRCPGAGRVEVFEEPEATDGFPDGWWCVRLWLAEPSRIGMAA